MKYLIVKNLMFGMEYRMLKSLKVLTKLEKELVKEGFAILFKTDKNGINRILMNGKITFE